MIETAGERPDLNGKLLKDEYTPDYWLVYHGTRHRLVSLPVLRQLFQDDMEAEVFPGLNALRIGADLVEGSCLIKADDTLAVFLFTLSDLWGLRRHFIPTYEDLLGYRFDLSKVRSLPPLVLEALPPGPDLVASR